jgi:hypothetical protein
MLLLLLVVDEVWQESSGTAANRGLKPSLALFVHHSLSSRGLCPGIYYY